jgi:quercetin dioxygenase-like cupin family protein
MAGKLKSIVLGAGEGETYWVLGSKYTVKVRGGDTGGSFTLLEAEIAPNSSPMPHIHRNEDETFIMLEGQLSVNVGKLEYTAAAGTTAFLPRNVKHTFWNHTDKWARMQILYTPAGLEEFFTAVGFPVGSPNESTPPVTEHDYELLYAKASQYKIKYDPMPSTIAP